MMSITLTSVKWLMVVISVLIAWAPTLSTQNHYCSIDKSHTLCKFQGIGAKCKNPFEVGIPAQDRRLIMDLHNSLRSQVATGAERRGRPGPQPSASNMRQMEWDDELALTAQRLAEQCKYTHDCLNCRKVDRFLTGQNLYQFSENLIREGSNWSQAIMAWYDEVALYNPRGVDYFDFIKELGHYTQMLWADTYKMGCGYVYYKDGKWNRKLYVCNYGPAGNIITTQMYKRGAPCSDCPEGTSCSNQYAGLCSGGGGGGRPFYAPAAPAPAPTTPRPTKPPTTRRPTTTSTTTRRTTTTTTTTTPRPTTTRPSKIIFNEIESNEIEAFDNFQQNPIDISSRLGIPAKKTLQGSSSRNSFFSPQRHSENRFSQTTSLAPRRQTSQPTFSRFATTRRPTTVTTTTTRRSYSVPTTTARATTKKIIFSQRIFPEQQQNKNKQKNNFDTDYYSTTIRPSKTSQFKDNRISSGTINVPTTSNRFSSFNNRQKVDPTRKASQPETKVIRMSDTPALSVEDSNSILLFCDFDFAKCPVRYTGQLWNYTAYETPGYGHGFATIVGPRGSSNLQIRSDVYPTGSEGLICVHFRFVHYLFGTDGGPAKTNGLRPDGQPINFIVNASTSNKVTTSVEISDRSKSAYDWLTGRIQFKDLHSQFLMNFQVPKNPLEDNLYLAVDDILITQGVCHT